jgi:transglutaminase-like putative cysteine protease
MNMHICGIAEMPQAASVLPRRRWFGRLSAHGSDQKGRMAMKVRICSGLLAGALLLTLVGCGAGSAEKKPAETGTAGLASGGTEVQAVMLGALLDEGVPMTSGPAVSTVLTPTASGVQVKKNASAAIDYSNVKDGYVMVNWLEGGTPKLKVQVKGPNDTTYTYNLRTDGTYETFPLSDGSGKYTVTVYKNVADSSYSSVVSAQFNVKLTDEFAPFLRPNQYVNFTSDSKAVAKAAELCEGVTDNLEKVDLIYTYVINNVTYDKAKAATVQSGYLPDVDETLKSGTGICFDYASLMAAMLRSQGVPVKLVVGYTGEVYHSWLNVWSEESGWIESVIYFDGESWKLMDPTFASSGKSSDSIMQYIGNGDNYTAKYLY